MSSYPIDIDWEPVFQLSKKTSVDVVNKIVKRIDKLEHTIILLACVSTVLGVFTVWSFTTRRSSYDIN